MGGKGIVMPLNVPVTAANAGPRDARSSLGDFRKRCAGAAGPARYRSPRNMATTVWAYSIDVVIDRTGVVT